MKELAAFLNTYKNAWGGIHPITADVFLKLIEKFKDYK